MADDAPNEGRRIVTCDDCGTPYPAVVEEDELLLVGAGSGACPNCAGEEFSKLSL